MTLMQCKAEQGSLSSEVGCQQLRSLMNELKLTCTATHRRATPKMVNECIRLKTTSLGWAIFETEILGCTTYEYSVYYRYLRVRNNNVWAVNASKSWAGLPHVPLLLC